MTKFNTLEIFIISFAFVSVKSQYLYNAYPSTYSPYPYGMNYANQFVNYPYYSNGVGATPSAVQVPTGDPIVYSNPVPAPVAIAPVPVPAPVVQNVPAAVPAAVIGGNGGVKQNTGHYELYQYGRSGLPSTEAKNYDVSLNKTETNSTAETSHNQRVPVPILMPRFLRPYNLFGPQRHFELFSYGSETLMPYGVGFGL